MKGERRVENDDDDEQRTTNNNIKKRKSRVFFFRNRLNFPRWIRTIGAQFTTTSDHFFFFFFFLLFIHSFHVEDVEKKQMK